MTTTAQSSTQPHYNIVISKRKGTVDVLQITSFSKIKARVSARRKAQATYLALEQKLSALEQTAGEYKSISEQLDIQRNKLRALPASVSDHFAVQYRTYAMAIHGDEWMPSATVVNPGNTGVKGFVILDSLTPMNVPVSLCNCLSYIVNSTNVSMLD
jgi:muconolactone delta-isomerase